MTLVGCDRRRGGCRRPRHAGRDGGAAWGAATSARNARLVRAATESPPPVVVANTAATIATTAASGDELRLGQPERALADRLLQQRSTRGVASATLTAIRAPSNATPSRPVRVWVNVRYTGQCQR